MTSRALTDDWNRKGGPKYPHEKVVQFCFRNYSPGIRNNIRALDLGCGSGVHTVFLATEGFQVTGTDISEVGIANTRRKLEALGLSAELRVEGIDVVDFPEQSFDLIICTGVFDCTGPATAKKAIERVFKVLRRGGRGWFLFASERDFRVTGENPSALHGYTEEEVTSLFGQGFSGLHLDRYITTYESGKIEENDWLVTLER